MSTHLLLPSSCSHADPVRVHASAVGGHLGKAATAAIARGAVEGLEAVAIAAVSGVGQLLTVVVAVSALGCATQAQATAVESAAMGAVGQGAQVGDGGGAAVEGAAVEGAVGRDSLALRAASTHAAPATAAIIVKGASTLVAQRCSQAWRPCINVAIVRHPGQAVWWKYQCQRFGHVSTHGYTQECQWGSLAQLTYGWVVNMILPGKHDPPKLGWGTEPSKAAARQPCRAEAATGSTAG